MTRVIVSIQNGARRAMTLIELLAGLSILALAVAAAGPWMTSSIKAQRAVVASVAERSALERTLAALREDLDASRPETIRVDAGTALTMLTSHAPPGDEPGWRRVAWRIDRERGELTRSEIAEGSSDRRRAALRGAAGIVVAPLFRGGEERRPAALEITLAGAAGSVARLVWEARL